MSGRRESGSEMVIESSGGRGWVLPFCDCARVVVEREEARIKTQASGDPQKIVRREQRKSKKRGK